ncbi:amino acid ABC transporter ATP-binding protein [Helicobacter didelphidarum]|uniref:Amino acid ABC transporter ATP-binding protein n=1 Tax=Helicobacter didelphidarum TaxID=2040648 RepID=A0A3D8IJF3_9HELI|nr:amino acid ABC transporter ATP-binding protein [Helicobacter didelphidarum]RDU65362.1 amino acid ABC transporter ATP-binding protein [Helicobacter didelphidarum]
MIEIHNLCKKFGNTNILKNISLEVKSGEIIAIIGPSGAGKSTFLRSINLLEYPHKGSIRIDNITLDYAKISQRLALFPNKSILQLRQKSAMVFQQHNLFTNKNCLENVAEALIIVQKIPKKEAFDIALENLKKVGLEDKAFYYTHELSGGQAQRVGIARALALNPSVMLFDEPTSALDPELVGEVLESIKVIQDKTMLIVTHELNFARAVADRIVFMTNGEIIEQKPPQDFFNQPKHERVKQFLEKMSIFKRYF